MQKIGIYSGTFDPVHEGHIDFANETIKQAGLEKVFFMVEPRPRRKQGVKAFEHRIRMVQLATMNSPKLGSIILEQDRFTSRDTLPLLTKRFHGARLYMLIGGDMLAHMPTWPKVDELLNSVDFIVGLRKLDKKEANSQIKAIEAIHGKKSNFRIIQAPKPEISSRNIKSSLKHSDTAGGLTVLVAQYIKEQRLYASPDV